MPSPSLALVFAHPDDETYATGGTVARYTRAGVACALYVATDGDAGKTAGIAVSSRAELGRLRRAELQAACEVLGIGALRCGGHPDGALATVDQEAFIGEIVEFLRAHRPAVVVTFGPEGAPTGHRDHKALSRAATAAFFLAGLATAYPEQLERGRTPHRPGRLYYVSWEPPLPEGLPHPAGLPITARIPILAQHPVKYDAFLAHRTQHGGAERFRQLAMRDDEPFTLASGTPQPAAVVADLFAGL